MTLALVWLEVSKMFKHEDAGLMFFGELHDAATGLMSTLFIKCAYLCPQGRIVLFAFRNNACLTWYQLLSRFSDKPRQRLFSPP
jgi:hypothetical protein